MGLLDRALEYKKNTLRLDNAQEVEEKLEDSLNEQEEVLSDSISKDETSSQDKDNQDSFVEEKSQNEKNIEEAQVTFDDKWEEHSLEQYREKGIVKKEDLIEASPLNDIKINQNQDYLIENANITLPLDLSYVYQNRIDSLLSLIDFTKELSNSQDEDDLWNAVILGILGQIASKEAAIFYRDDTHFHLKISHGFEFPDENLITQRSNIERIANKESGIYYIKEILKQVKGDEQLFFSNISAELFIPIMKYENMVGFLLVGKPLGTLDYNIDDLLFLKLLGESLGAFHDSVQRIVYVSEQKKLWDEREVKNQQYLSYLELLERQSSEDKIIKALNKILTETFHLGMYIFLIGEEDTFHPKFSFGMNHKSLERFHISLTDTWAMESRLQSGWFQYNDFKEDSALVEKFSAEDLAIVENMYILPFLFKKQLQAIFVLFEVNKSLSNEDLRYIQSLLQSTYWFFITYKFSKNKEMWQKIGMKDPLFALKKLIKEKEKSQVPYTSISIQVSNAGRLEYILGKQALSGIKGIVKANLNEYLYKNDFFGEIFSYHFLAIIDELRSETLEMILSNIKNEIKEIFSKDEIRPILRIKKMFRPAENLIGIEEFLFD